MLKLSTQMLKTFSLKTQMQQSLSGKAARNNAKRPVLYSYFRSSSAWRVRIALALKGIDYEYKPVHLLNMEQRNPEFLKVNPLGQVPVLIINGITLTQSVSIIEYLEETYPEVPLLPQSSLERAKVREVIEIISSGIQPITNLRVLQKVSKEKAKQIEWLQYWGNEGFSVLEETLGRYSGTNAVGNDVTLADVFLIPAAAGAQRWGLDFTKYPTIHSITTRLSSLEPFKAAHPTVQPDCPAKLRS